MLVPRRVSILISLLIFAPILCCRLLMHQMLRQQWLTFLMLWQSRVLEAINRDEEIDFFKGKKIDGTKCEKRGERKLSEHFDIMNLWSFQ